MPNVIRLNDPTSHGGKVTRVEATHFTVGGIAVACVGDKCVCPIHGEGTIVEGNSRHTIGGASVAYDGHRTSCGATLTSTVDNFSIR
ncbi:PAAR domain-containing protein [Massilia sp. UYP11]|uniref:PAAR domain-containing protein n=1 Tax=Massilia sp. UYP11 TaxID=1756385 RepID=UPI003D1EF627